MGGKETSKRASAASRATLVQGAHPRLVPAERLGMEKASRLTVNRTAYLYAFGFTVALATYLFALSL
jgi:hypothetical protein